MLELRYMRVLLAAVAVAALLNGAPRVRTDMLVSAKWLSGHLNDPSIAVLHVARDRAAYDKGHLPGARLLLMDEIVTERAGVPNELRPAADLQKTFERLGISNGTRVVLYGDTLYASRAFFTLGYLGHPRITMLDGGVERWRAEKLPLTADEPKPEKGVFRPRVSPEIVATLDGVRDLSYEAAELSASDVIILDVRSPEVSAKGRIPGSRNVFWMKGLRSKEDPSLKSPAELRKLYALPAAPRVIVTYCNSGVQASQSYFVLRYLGYSDVRMYDGSFGQWSKHPELPIQH